MIQKKQYETRRPKEKEMIFGVRAVIEAIEAGKVLDKVLVRRDMSSAIGRELLIKLEDVVQNAFDEGRVPFLVVLDGVTDVRNFGAIARTCVCAGVHALIIGTRGSAAINGDAVKASAGALHSLPICKVENLQNALQYLQESGLRIVAATEHTDRNYTEVDMTVPTCIVMGSEEKGIYEENLKLCTDQVRLPMTGVIESLNVSVAAGVFIYEAVRQRSCK